MSCGFQLGARASEAGAKLFAFDTAASTNIEALRSAQQGECGPAWFVTSEQTAGYGRRGRAWIAPRGNLAASVLVTLDVAPAVAATLGFVAGVAIRDVLQSLSRGAADFKLKWPNDVLANGRKLVGIGLEAHALSAGLGVIVGIGTNVVAAPEGTAFPATSLAAEGVRLTAEDIFPALSDAWAVRFALWDNGRGFAAVRAEWLDHAFNIGSDVSVALGERIVEGIFETIDESGCMIVVTAKGRVPITAGDVYFGNAKSAGAA